MWFSNCATHALNACTSASGRGRPPSYSAMRARSSKYACRSWAVQPFGLGRRSATKAALKRRSRSRTASGGWADASHTRVQIQGATEGNGGAIANSTPLMRIICPTGGLGLCHAGRLVLKSLDEECCSSRQGGITRNGCLCASIFHRPDHQFQRLPLRTRYRDVHVRASISWIICGSILSLRKMFARFLAVGEPAAFQTASFSGVSLRRAIVSWRWIARTRGNATTASAETIVVSILSGIAGTKALANLGTEVPICFASDVLSPAEASHRKSASGSSLEIRIVADLVPFILLILII